MRKMKIAIAILLILGMLVLGCVGKEKQATPTSTPSGNVSESEVSGIDSYSTELEKMISDTTELENIDLGLIDETTF